MYIFQNSAMSSPILSNSPIVIQGQNVTLIHGLTASSEGLAPLSLPLFASKVNAGFPSPADDHLEAELNLNDYLIKHPAATFLVRAKGDSMIELGIHDNDILIVDKSLTPKHEDVVIAALAGELTVKQLIYKNSQAFLCPANPAYQAIALTDDSDCLLWGVVTHAIHALRAA